MNSSNVKFSKSTARIFGVKSGRLLDATVSALDELAAGLPTLLECRKHLPRTGDKPETLITHNELARTLKLDPEVLAERLASIPVSPVGHVIRDGKAEPVYIFDDYLIFYEHLTVTKYAR